MLDNQLLENFMHDFYGYGTFHAPIWFVGMEEGGGGSLDEISRRLAAWDTRGRCELEDIAEYHSSINITRYCNEPVALQPTWSKLIRVLLCSQGLIPTTQQVRAFQRNNLGQAKSDTCLVELLPLPSPNTSNWLYSAFSSLPYLSNRQTYVDHFSRLRSRHIQSRVVEHRPSVVVFYGLQYLPFWQTVAEGVLQPTEPLGQFVGRHGNTMFAVMKHPTAIGVTNDYFHSVGQWIASQA